MKKLILFIFICILPSLSRSQNYYWAKGAPSNGVSEGWANCLDANNNLYVAGPYDGPTIIFGTYTLTNIGSANSFLVKYDSNGNVLWARNDGGSNRDYHYSVSADASGNVFVVGYFESPTMIVGTYTLTNSGGSDIYLIKYDTNGNVLWAKSAGSINNDWGLSVSTDPSGNAIIGGTFCSPTIAIGSTVLTNTGARTAFIAKYSSSGTPLWAKASVGATGKQDQGAAVRTDLSGNIYFTGSFESPTMALGTYSVNNTINYSMFLGKYDTNGNALWARASVCSNPNTNITGRSVTSDLSGNVYLTGEFARPGPVSATFGTITVSDPNGGSMYLAKYTPGGNVSWIRTAGGSGGTYGFTAATYSAGVFVEGMVSGAVTIFGTYTLSTPSNSFDPMYIVEYDLNGNVKCADVLGSGGDDQSGLSVDNSGSAYISGDFSLNPPIFVLGTTTLTGLGGGEDYFVTKFNCLAGVGVEELNKENGSALYPNPNNGVFNLKIGNELSNGELILFNALGQKVHEQKIDHGTNSINIPELRKGLYNYILLQNKQKMGDGKVIIE
jgi:hypothetical protein